MRIQYIIISFILMVVILTIILSVLGLIDISPIFDAVTGATNQ